MYFQNNASPLNVYEYKLYCVKSIKIIKIESINKSQEANAMA